MPGDSHEAQCRGPARVRLTLQPEPESASARGAAFGGAWANALASWRRSRFRRSCSTPAWPGRQAAAALWEATRALEERAGDGASGPTSAPGRG